MHTPKNTFQAGRVALIAAGHAIHDTYIAFLPTLLPVLIQTLSISRASAGLFSVFTQLPSLLQPFIGYVADRVSLRWIVILSPLVTCTLMSLVGVAPTYLLIALLLLGVGVSSASLHATGPVLAGKLSGETLGRGMSFSILRE
ncbi:MFS transporter, partial [Levilinea saccharolytica]|uniref:MFS transporter n=1 Tax=Levilinea saccharolytica TaxID=229921 RepID=UPI000A609F20